MFERLLWLEETGSTQNLIKGLPPHSVVVARRQRSGRGRMGRRWHSEAGGLYFSFSLNRGFKDEDCVPLVVAYAVGEYLRKEGLKPAIKWVNDLYLMGKKVCGVLCESSKDRLYVGIGLNLNQKEFPGELEAVSLSVVSGKTYREVDVLLELFDSLAGALDLLKRDGFRAFKEHIESILLYKDQEVVLYTPKPVVGILKGLATDGSLVLITHEGERNFTVGDISLRLFMK
ncbi:MAG: biotin--[acetyl-CoA-carboxylase] ligase [Acidobacteria bacterium]|jgi:BirA family biotin operon repressor/biotin-[acetyl-CoA-carboxylase] ligase|nr:MAG: biotin--[acetyl-CoA-carboxylase] ligase [Acidobacteriota bacterium]